MLIHVMSASHLTVNHILFMSALKLARLSASFQIIAGTHAHAEIAHFPTRCIIKAWETRGHRLSAFRVLMRHWVGKCVIFACAWVLAFIPWPVINIKVAMQKLHIFTHPFSAWIVSWSWDVWGTRSQTLIPWSSKLQFQVVICVLEFYSDFILFLGFSF